MRCFIALRLPEGVRKKILGVQEVLEGSGTFEGKMTEFENIHLTLKFLGEIDEVGVADVIGRLERIKWSSFETEVGEAGVFSKELLRIIWLKLNGVEELQKKVDNVLGEMFESEFRFMSHVTIVRVKMVADKEKLFKLLKEIKLEDVGFKVSSFYLMKSGLTSGGPKYEIIKEFKSS